MNKERLLKLANFVKKLDKDDFDLGVVRQELECGTIACAIGWCPNAFPGEVYYHSFHKENCSVYLSDAFVFPIGNGMSGAMLFFGLTEQEFHFLFTPDGYSNICDREDISTSTFVGRVQRFVNNNLTIEDHSDKNLIDQAYLRQWRW